MNVLQNIVKFFAAVPGSIKDHINSEELLKSVLTAVGSGALTSGSTDALVDAVANVIPAIPLIVPNPPIAGLVVAILTLIVDLYRRKGHGNVAVFGGIDPGSSSPANPA